MSFLSFPSTITHSSCSPLIISKPSNSSNHIVKCSKKKNVAKSSYISGPLIKTSLLSSHSASSFAAFGVQDSGGAGGEDIRALETVLKLYKAIKERDINLLSDVIGEECRCVCNFVSTFQPCHGKTQVVEFFSSLLLNMGKNIEFVVQPTLHDGMTVAVHWKLEWKETRIPLGQGFSIYMCHIYQGKVLIRNVEMFMEPLLHIQPLRLKIMGTLMSVMDRLGPKELYKGLKAKWTIYTLLAFFFMAAIVVFVVFL